MSERSEQLYKIMYIDEKILLEKKLMFWEFIQSDIYSAGTHILYLLLVLRVVGEVVGSAVGVSTADAASHNPT